MSSQTACTAAGESSSDGHVAKEVEASITASSLSNKNQGDVGVKNERQEPTSAPVVHASDVFMEHREETLATTHVQGTPARVELTEPRTEAETVGQSSSQTATDSCKPSQVLEGRAQSQTRTTVGGKTTSSSGDVSQSQQEAPQANEPATEHEAFQPRPATGGKSVMAYPLLHHVGAADGEALDGGEVCEGSGNPARPVTGGKTVLLAVDPRRFEEDSTQSQDRQNDLHPSHPSEGEHMDVDEEEEEEEEEEDESQLDEEGDGSEIDEEEDEGEVDEEGDESEDVDLDLDVREELDNVLSNANSTGTFAFNRTYPNAPNPILHIKDLGTFGLPLSSREAAAIKAHSSQAPFGMADRTVVDKSVRDTWEIDAAQVTFRDTERWPKFLETTVGEVCQTLGVNFAASQPRCELYKLLLYETGSHFLPHVDTEKQDGMFATIVIVLPSEFTGGAVRVSHAGLAETYDCSSTSLSQTTVLAWYTDVMHEVKPVTSGYRLALSFNLVHTTTSLRPAISGQGEIIQELRRILRAWKRNDSQDGAPTKLVYLLTHKYSQANLRGSALKGADAHRVALLDMIAREYGFRVGLASLVCHESGYAEECGGRRSYRGWGRCAYDSYDEEEDDVSMGEIESTEMSVESLVDIDGNNINQTLDLDTETETIPSELEEIVTGGEVDSQEYEGYMGNYGGTLDRWYRRTVLVIWPPWSNFDIMHGINGFTYACTQLAASSSTQATAEERELAEIVVLRASAFECERTIKSVCKVARSWKDLSLWRRAVKACEADRSISKLREKNVLGAIQVFGFGAIRDTLETALRNDSSSVSGLKFLDKLEEWVKSQGDAMTTDVAEWVEQTRTTILKNLKASETIESKYIVNLALRIADVAFLEQFILPQVKLMAAPLSLLECVTHLQGLSGLSLVDRSRLVHDMLQTAISKSNFYMVLDIAAKQNVPAPYSRTLPQALQVPTAAERAIQQASLCIEACFATGNEELIPQIMSKLTDFSNVVAVSAQRRAKEVLLPLIASLAPRVKQRGPERPIPDMKKLCDTASGLYLDSISASPGTIEKANISALFQAAIYGGEPGLVFSKFIPRLAGLRLSSFAIRTIVEELQAQRESLDSSGQLLGAALTQLVKKYGSSVSVDIPRSPTGYNYTSVYPPMAANGTVSRGNLQAICDAIDFCVHMNVPEASREIVTRVLKANSKSRERIRDILITLVPEIKSLIRKYGHQVSSPDYALIFQNVMVFWVVNILGQRPAAGTEVPVLNRLQGWNCPCTGCQPVRKFLLQDSERTKTLHRIGYRLRQHVEKELGRYGVGAATWETVRTSPQGLLVTKTNTIYEPVRWRAAQVDGLKILKSISKDTARQNAVLGTELKRVATALGLQVAVQPTAPATSGASTSAVQQSRTASANAQPAQSNAASNIRGSDGGENERPAKRRKTTYAQGDVIDLTSD